MWYICFRFNSNINLEWTDHSKLGCGSCGETSGCNAIAQARKVREADAMATVDEEAAAELTSDDLTANMEEEAAAMKEQEEIYVGADRPVLNAIFCFGGELFFIIPGIWREICEGKPPLTPHLVERNMVSKCT